MRRGPFHGFAVRDLPDDFLHSLLADPDAAFTRAGVRVLKDCPSAKVAVVPMPTPGGLTYEDCLGLLHGLAARGQIVGLILAEYVPSRDDPQRLCAQIAARLVTVAMGLMRR